MSKHTNGPWTDGKNPNNNGSIVSGPTGERICDVYEHEDVYGRGFYGDSANARLVAAAPEMLAALRLVKAKYEMSRGDFSVNRLKDEDNVKAMAAFIENLDFVTGHISSAVAKAEGSNND